MSSHRLLLAAAVAVPLGLLALAGWLEFKQTYAESQRQAERTAQALSEHAQRTLRTHELILDFVDRYTVDRPWDDLLSARDVHLVLANLKATSADVASVFMLDPKGRGLVSSRRFPMAPVDVSDRDYFQALRDKGGLHVSAPARGRLDNDRFFTVARRRSHPQGGFDGVISVSVNPQYFEAFYASLLDPSQAASLVRADGTILARHPDVSDVLTVLPPHAGLMRSVRAQPAAGAYVSRSIVDAHERMVAYRKVGDFPVYATFQFEMAGIWSAWAHTMVPYVLACVLAMALLLAGVAFGEQRARRAAAEARMTEAEAASRAKDLFVAALSHELRNPLAAISNAAEALQRRSGATPPVQIILRQITQLRRMLDDLLDTARAVYGKLKLEKRRIDLRGVAEAVLDEQLRPGSAQGRIEVRGEPWVEADPVRVKQMLDNLVDNAAKYGARHIEVHIEASGDWVQVAVRDDGQGIAPELLPRLFQPFVQGEQTLDRAQGGLGLGLALVSRLAALHGGSLVAASDGPGRGATFTLRLPRSEAPARRVDLAVARTHATSRRLLVVDDEPDARDSLRALLEIEGHSVALAADGESALEALVRFAPDVALLDIGLPHMDGYELARRMRAVSERVVLIAVTGYGQREDRDKARVAGFAAHLTKPFSYDELLGALAQSERRAAA